MHRRFLIAGVPPKANAPSEETNDHQDQRKQNPLRGGTSSWPEEGHQGEFWSDSIGVFSIDFDNVGDRVAPD